MEQHASSLLTIQEMAERLRVPISWLYSRTRQREADSIPVVRVGKYCRFDPQAVMAWIEKRQHGDIE